ncbi:hypothetical protein GGF46_002778 [Coemansia sp. RSA 552]|nr:hypothetical protein GGF46_002778 [Coemansia sp. RSA 552]
MTTAVRPTSNYHNTDPPELAVADHMHRRRSLAPTQLGKYIGEHTPGAGSADPYQAARNIGTSGARPTSAYASGQKAWAGQPAHTDMTTSQQGRPSKSAGHGRDIGSRHPGHRERREHHIGDFLIKQVLGKGTFSKVCLAEHRATKQKFALKFIKAKSPQGGSTDKHNIRVEREIKLLSLLYHPNIVRIYDVIQHSKFTMIVMEHNSGGELLHHIRKRGRLHESEARVLFRQIVSAMDYTHRNCIIHRDLKMENIMLDSDGRIRIIDFGFANTFEWDKQLDTFCGSPFYAAPEMVNGIKYTGPEVDVWSMGVILFFMLCGRTPFEGESIKVIYDKISRGRFNLAPFLSKDAQDLLQQILTVDPRMRISMKGIIDHPWTNKEYDQPVNNHLQDRPVVVLQPDEQLLQKMPVYKYSIPDVVAALARSDMALTPMVSIYHLLVESRRRKATRNARRSHATHLGVPGSSTDTESTSPAVHYPQPGDGHRPTSRSRHSYAPVHTESHSPGAQPPAGAHSRAQPSAPHAFAGNAHQAPYIGNRDSDLAMNTMESPSFGASQYEPPRPRKGSTASGQISVNSSLNLDASSPFLQDDRRSSRSSRIMGMFRKSMPFLKSRRPGTAEMPPFDQSQNNVDNRNRVSIFQAPFRRFSAAPSAQSLNIQGGSRMPSYYPPPPEQPLPPQLPPALPPGPKQQHSSRPMTATANEARPAAAPGSQRPATSAGHQPHRHHRHTDFGPTPAHIQNQLQPRTDHSRKSEPPRDLPLEPSANPTGNPRRTARPLSVVAGRPVMPLRLNPTQSNQNNQPPVPFTQQNAGAQLPAALTSRGSAPTAIGGAQHRQQQQQQQQQRPANNKGAMRGMFNLRCTMFGPLDEIQAKIEQVLKTKSIVLRKMADDIYSCEDQGLRFEVIIETIQGHLHTVKFKRLEGNWWGYKKLTVAISNELQSYEQVAV